MWRKVLVAGTIAVSLLASTALAMASPGDHSVSEPGETTRAQPWTSMGDRISVDSPGADDHMKGIAEMEGFMGGFDFADMEGFMGSFDMRSGFDDLMEGFMGSLPFDTGSGSGFGSRMDGVDMGSRFGGSMGGTNVDGPWGGTNF